MKLSILILTVPKRQKRFFPRLTQHLLEQIGDREDIEVVALYDNKKRSVGEKRNNLLDIANGEYLTFIDDDDRISDDYIESIMAVLDSTSPDVVVYDTICTINGIAPKLCKYGVEYEYHDEAGPNWTGKPSHTMFWKSSIAKKHKYPSIDMGEDMDWVTRAVQDVETQERIDKVLYYYDHNTLLTETRPIYED